ncbi:MAG: hypothetical protein V2J02_21115 [Pseudomonadales bacterium]|nr:hypothetical protein [Pseudomonadales bacterium]
MDTKSLPKDPTAAYALGARDAFEQADHIAGVAECQRRTLAEVREQIQQRRSDAEHQGGPYFPEGPGDRIAKVRRMVLCLELMGIDGLQGACTEALEGYSYILRAIGEELEAADESFDGYRERPFSGE